MVLVTVHDRDTSADEQSDAMQPLRVELAKVGPPAGSRWQPTDEIDTCEPSDAGDYRPPAAFHLAEAEALDQSGYIEDVERQLQAAGYTIDSPPELDHIGSLSIRAQSGDGPSAVHIVVSAGVGQVMVSALRDESWCK